MRAAAVVLALALATPALAQETGGLNAHGFALTAQDGDIRDHYVLHRPGHMNGMNWFAGGLAEYAYRPLVLVTETDDDRTIEPALNHVVAANLVAGISPIDRLRFTASAPVFLTSSSFGESQGASFGDLRLDVMGLLVDPDDTDGIGVAIVPWIDLPTGAADKWLGRGGVGGGGVLAGTVEEADYTLTSNLGVELSPGVDVGNQRGGASLVAGAGGNYLIDDVSSIGLEARIRAPFRRNERAGTGTPSQAILSYRRTSDVGGYFTGGLAVPLTSGVGAAVFRVFVGGGFGKLGASAPGDKDGDGITDDLDACPTEPETLNDYVDEDGCPDTLSELVVQVRWNGQPMPGADLVIAGPDGEDKASLGKETTYARPVAPDTMWAIKGTMGDCLIGEVKKLVDGGRDEAVLDLKLLPSATVKLHVHDSAGNPVPGVRVEWDTDKPECVPEPPPLGADGKALIDIGPGRHKIIVGAPGYRVVEVPVLASRGDELPVEVTLAPTKLKVEKNRIVILEKVNFETGKAVIQPSSYELLNEVADVIRRNPEAGRVEVQGHTDDVGSDKSNLDLSQRRAEAVRKYLMEHGVDKERLVAVGYGESKPQVPNTSRANRAINRRVEFLLIDQKEQGISEPAP